MSRVYFHSEHDTAEVRGSERAWGDCLGRGIAMEALDLSRPAESMRWNKALVALIEPKLDERPRFAALTLNVDSDKHQFVLPDGSRHAVWSTFMNTAIALGSPPVQFLTRLHGQCEIHAWVAGEDRAWLADVIEDGRTSGVMRARAGWEEVIALLRSRSDGEVVTSYSVTDQFPSQEHAGHKGDEAEWHALPESERWRLGVAALRASTGELQITPDNLGDPMFFGHGGKGTNGLKIMEMLGEKAFQEKTERLAAIKARGELPSIYDL